MRATIAVILIGILLGGALAFGSAQVGPGLDETPPQETTGPDEPADTAKPPPTPPPEGYFKQESGEVRPTETLEYDWSRVEIRATILGVHFNINQPARNSDNSADNWSLVFHLEESFKETDYVRFCGPESTITIQVRDNKGDKPTIYEGTLTGVPECNW